MSDSDAESVDSVTLVTPLVTPLVAPLVTSPVTPLLTSLVTSLVTSPVTPLLTSLRPATKRRRVMDPSTISSVPIYSNKVDKCLWLKSNPVLIMQQLDSSTSDDADAALCFDSPGPKHRDDNFSLTDSEDELEEVKPTGKTSREAVALRSPSPPSTPGSPTLQVSPQAWRAMYEVNSRLGSVISLLSSSPERLTISRRRRLAPALAAASLPLSDDDDVILMTPVTLMTSVTPVELPGEAPTVGREFKLKFRCQTGIHRVPVVSSRPLSEAVEALSVKLKVPPSCILLLRNEVELPVHSSANQLGLTIADIVDCVVVTDEVKQGAQGSDIITVRLQGKDKGSMQEYSLRQDAPLGSILSQYAASRSASDSAKLHFVFDGSKVVASHTPAQLDMEDGNVIEVWS